MERFILGVHKTKDLNDGYMGSGKYLLRAQKKYGIEYFSKEYLAVFDRPEEMYEMESLLVNEEFVQDEFTYNLNLGGEGSWDYCNRKHREKWKNDPIYKENLGKKYPVQIKKLGKFKI